MKPTIRSPRRGQALTEFLVAAFALVPLFMLLPVIAKYQDMAHSTQLASRYVAFDAMVRNDSMSSWKPEAQLADEVRRRFFSNTEAWIKTDDVAGDFKAHQNAFWRMPGDDALIRTFGDVTVSYGNNNGTSHNQGFSSTSDGAPFTRAGELQLRARGIYTANVAVRVANLPAGLRSLQPFDNINLVIARSTSVVVDPWMASGPSQVESRIAASPTVFPAASLRVPAAFVSAAVTVIDWPGGLSGPRLGELEFWRDVVPNDRLRAGD